VTKVPTFQIRQAYWSVSDWWSKMTEKIITIFFLFVMRTIHALFSLSFGKNNIHVDINYYISRVSRISLRWFSCGSSTVIEFEFGVSVLVEGGKPESPERNPRGQERTKNLTLAKNGMSLVVDSLSYYWMIATFKTLINTLVYYWHVIWFDSFSVSSKDIDSVGNQCTELLSTHVFEIPKCDPS